MTPSKIGRYEIISELGQGAMGVVYKARDPMLDRIVAIKTVSMSLYEKDSAEYEARFYVEARAAGGLSHPNIIVVYDIGKTEDLVYMAMEYLQGQEVRDLLREGKPLPVREALDIAAQVADGLGYAHEHHVVHRDIKPANIMVLPSGRAKIMDFGIARLRSSDVRTQTGIVLGSPKYMSPEQVLGRRVDHRSDIFSLGVVLYQMLAGNAPFTGDNLNTVMYSTINFAPSPLGESNPEVPQLLDLIVAKALAKRPDDRYQSAYELAVDLRECAGRLEAGTLPSRPRVHVTEAEPQMAAAKPDLGTNPMQRDSDRAPPASAAQSEPEGQPQGLAVSNDFDSLEATMRLATAIGVSTDYQEYEKTQRIQRPPAVASTAPPIAPPAASPEEARLWLSNRDIIAVATVIVLALLGAALIVMH